MPEAREDKERVSIELLRLISLFVEYMDRTTYLITFTILALLMGVILALFFSTQISSVYMIVGIAYGMVLVVLVVRTYRTRMNRRFKEYLDAVSQSTLMKSSEYEKIVKRMQNRLSREYSLRGLDETDELFAEMNKRITELDKERKQLREQIAEMKKRADRRVD